MDARNADAGRELIITRIFDAPRALVWKAFTEPKHLKHWLGPRGFKASDLSGEVRPGGKWRSRIRSRDRDLWQGGEYLEVEEPKRLVYTFAWEDGGGNPTHKTTITVTFEERGGKTHMTFRQGMFETVDSRDGHGEGWNSTFDRLAKHLAEMRRQAA